MPDGFGQCLQGQSTDGSECFGGLGFQGFSKLVAVLQDPGRGEWQAPDRARHLHHPHDTDSGPLIIEETENLAIVTENICESESTCFESLQRGPVSWRLVS